VAVSRKKNASVAFFLRWTPRPRHQDNYLLGFLRFLPYNCEGSLEVTHQGINQEIKFDVFRFPGSQLPAGKNSSSLSILYLFFREICLDFSPYY
jgi:hypothetical protein